VASTTIGEWWWIRNYLERSGCRRRCHILLLSSKGWWNRKTSSKTDDVPDENRTRNLLNTSPHPYRCSGCRQCLPPPPPKLATEDDTAKAADNYTLSAQHHDMPQSPTDLNFKTVEVSPKTDTPMVTKIVGTHFAAIIISCQQRYPSILPAVFCHWLDRKQCTHSTYISQICY